MGNWANYLDKVQSTVIWNLLSDWPGDVILNHPGLGDLLCKWRRVLFGYYRRMNNSESVVLSPSWEAIFTDCFQLPPSSLYVVSVVQDSSLLPYSTVVESPFTEGFKSTAFHPLSTGVGSISWWHCRCTLVFSICRSCSCDQPVSHPVQTLYPLQRLYCWAQKGR